MFLTTEMCEKNLKKKQFATKSNQGKTQFPFKPKGFNNLKTEDFNYYYKQKKKITTTITN